MNPLLCFDTLVRPHLPGVGLAIAYGAYVVKRSASAGVNSTKWERTLMAVKAYLRGMAVYACVRVVLRLATLLYRLLATLPTKAMVSLCCFACSLSLIGRAVMRMSAIRVRVRTLLLDWMAVRLEPPRISVQYGLTSVGASVRVGHPHGEAAAKRNGASRAMVTLIRRLGLTPHQVSGSARPPVEGTRDYYQLSDLGQRPKADEITDSTVFVMVDVDYYADMDFWLSFGRPILIYSFVPTEVAGGGKEQVWRFNDHKVECTVSGGGKYVHELWDYNLDVAWTAYSRWPLLKFGADALGLLTGLFDATGVTVFTIDHFDVGDDRRIISLMPFVQLPYFMDLSDFGARFARLQTKTGEFNILRSMADPPQISLARDGHFGAVTCSLEIFEHQRTAWLYSTTHHLGDTERRCRGLSAANAGVMHDFLHCTEPLAKNMVHAPGAMALHYQTLWPYVFEEGKTYARRYAASPTTLQAYYPRESYNNDFETVVGRVTKPQRAARKKIAQTMTDGSPSQTALEYAAASFVLALVPEAGIGIPLSIAEVGIRQARPTQRIRTAQRKMDCDENFVVRSFQKREAASAPSCPRNISQVPTMHTLQLSSFTLSYKDAVLKTHTWFIPGMNPAQVADSLEKFCDQQGSVHATDYARFDGTITKWLHYNVVFAAMLRWVQPEFKARLLRLLELELNPRATTKQGVKYEPGESRLSGSPITSDGNTVINAFVTYAAALRSGCDEEEAIARIGMPFGDDGVTSGRTPAEVLDKVARELGLVLKCQTLQPGEPVPYLGRLFLDPWTAPYSIQDPLRTLAKLNTTVDSVHKLEQAGRAKAEGYLVTDNESPIVGAWCRAYLRSISPCDSRTDDRRYWLDGQGFTTNSWPQGNRACMRTTVAELLDISITDIVVFEAKLSQYTGGPFQMPVLEVAVHPPAKLESLVGGVIVPQGGDSNSADSPKVEPKVETTADDGQMPGTSGGSSQGHQPSPPKGPHRRKLHGDADTSKKGRGKGNRTSQETGCGDKGTTGTRTVTRRPPTKGAKGKASVPGAGGADKGTDGKASNKSPVNRESISSDGST